MKYLTVAGLLILMLCVAATAGEPMQDDANCPANHAAKQGFNPFGAFHTVIAPAWHDAWPAKDYDALLAAAPKFTEAFKAIAELKPELKSPTKIEKFETRRAALGKIIEEYAAAAEKGDKQAVYDLLPDLHEKFEQAASSLVPTSYAALSSLLTVSESMLNSELPEMKDEEIASSADALLKHVDELNEESIPEDLLYYKESLLEQFSSLKTTAQKVKECCEKKDMDGYKEHITNFHTQVKGMVDQYL